MTRKPRFAAIATAYFPLSHADVIVSRWLEPRPTDSQWGWPVNGNEPNSQIASLYVVQTERQDASDPHRDISREIARRYQVPLFDNVRDALTLGGDEMAVDGVLLIGEHGDYPMSARGQKMYPRFELWTEIVAVMRETRRVIPLFCDKHFSYENSRALEMFNGMRQLGIPFLAGSSLPFCKMEPPLEVTGAKLQDAVTLFYGGAEVYGFHILELAQSIIEHRAGGESGIRRVAAHCGEAVWNILDADAHHRALFEAAVSAARRVEAGEMRHNCRSPVAFCVEHADGFRATHFMLQGHLQEFIVAIREKSGLIQAARWDGGDGSDFYGHFATLNRAIEELFIEGRPPAPPERALLTTLTINTLMEALEHPSQWRDTPHLMRFYAPLQDSRPGWPRRTQAPALAPRSFVE